jgi:hypothetical protein
MAKSVHELCAELYEDEELASAVADDANTKGTVTMIEKGLLTLPHPKDAKAWHEKQKAEKAAQEKH